MNRGEAITTWLKPLRPVLDPGNQIDWTRLTALADVLDRTLVRYPVGPDLPAGVERSDRLRAIRQDLADRGHLDTTGDPALFQMLAQFVCGYRDIDLRDATGLGHGSLIARHGSPQSRQRWIARLLDGELAGIAVTEPHGGSRPAETRTRAVAGSDGTWLVTGRKTWISRLPEAAIFVLFFRAPNGRLAAAAVDTTDPGLHASRSRRPGSPAGTGVSSISTPCRSGRRTSCMETGWCCCASTSPATGRWSPPPQSAARPRSSIP